MGSRSDAPANRTLVRVRTKNQGDCVMPRLLALLLAILLASTAQAAPTKKTYFRLGQLTDATAATTPGTVLMGGSTDVDAAFQWLCSLADGGDFLVIRATGTDAYNPYV